MHNGLCPLCRKTCLFDNLLNLSFNVTKFTDNQILNEINNDSDQNENQNLKKLVVEKHKF
jgi:hypothetical protein